MTTLAAGLLCAVTTLIRVWLVMVILLLALLLTSYVRVIEGLARHLEIPEETAEPQLTGRPMAGTGVSDPPWREAALRVPGSPPRNP